MPPAPAHRLPIASLRDDLCGCGALTAPSPRRARAYPCALSRTVMIRSDPATASRGFWRGPEKTPSGPRSESINRIESTGAASPGGRQCARLAPSVRTSTQCNPGMPVAPMAGGLPPGPPRSPRRVPTTSPLRHTDTYPDPSRRPRPVRGVTRRRASIRGAPSGPSASPTGLGPATSHSPPASRRTAVYNYFLYDSLSRLRPRESRRTCSIKTTPGSFSGFGYPSSASSSISRAATRSNLYNVDLDVVPVSRPKTHRAPKRGPPGLENFFRHKWTLKSLCAARRVWARNPVTERRKLYTGAHFGVQTTFRSRAVVRNPRNQTLNVLPYPQYYVRY